jgi:hypothetical protein
MELLRLQFRHILLSVGNITGLKLLRRWLIEVPTQFQQHAAIIQPLQPDEIPMTRVQVLASKLV